MDRFQAMQAFTRIVELGAFGKAADSLELPRASVTQAIQQLEAHLGVQLLQRTTRQVSLTLDGQAYYERCVRLLAGLEEAESCFPRVLNNPRRRCGSSSAPSRFRRSMASSGTSSRRSASMRESCSICSGR